jgi:hypothetical protein
MEDQYFKDESKGTDDCGISRRQINLGIKRISRRHQKYSVQDKKF